MKLSEFFLSKISPVAYLVSTSFLHILCKSQTIVLDIVLTPKAAPAAFFYSQKGGRI
ncbi:MAG TPA: hypothetical protein VF189_00850 [Patescibacteria group bacterium]